MRQRTVASRAARKVLSGAERMSVQEYESLVLVAGKMTQPSSNNGYRTLDKGRQNRRRSSGK